ncbi:MAG: ABC transporter substrate-binding protein [Candidatus Woesearchaeota archaeon]
MFLNPDNPQAGLAMLQYLKQTGYEGPILANYFVDDPTVRDSGLAENITYFSDPGVPDSTQKEELLKEYKARYGEAPAFEYPFFSRYDTVFIIAQALREVGENTTAIRDYLYDLDGYEGVLGTYRFDKNGDVVGIKPSIKTIMTENPVTTKHI